MDPQGVISIHSKPPFVSAECLRQRERRHACQPACQPAYPRQPPPFWSPTPETCFGFASRLVRHLACSTRPKSPAGPDASARQRWFKLDLVQSGMVRRRSPPPKPRLRWTSSIAVPPKSKDHLSWLAFCRTSTPNLGAWIGLSLHPRDGRGRGGASAAPPTRGRCLSALSDCWLYPSLLARKAGECALPLLSTRPRTAVLQQGLVIIIPPTQSPPLPTAPSRACPLLIPLPY
jgi:hypothetical protein